MRYFVLLLSCLACIGQPFNPTVASWGGSTAVAAFDPTNIAGLYFQYSYKDFVVGQSVSNWNEKILSGSTRSLTNVVSAKWPTNSASGVFFNASWLTNGSPSTATSNFSVWISMTPTATPSGYHCLFSDSAGNRGFEIHAGVIDFFATTDHNMAAVTANVQVDFVYANGASYTNGVAGATIVPPTGNSTVGSVGSDSVNENYDGYIKYLYIWTNTILTSAQAVSLHTYGAAN